jgi:hypothetical protein
VGEGTLGAAQGGVDGEMTWRVKTLTDAELPTRIGPCESSPLGSMIAVRIKRSRQDDLALLGTLRADARLPNRAKRIRALCHALDVPILPTDPAARSPPLTIDGVAEQPP